VPGATANTANCDDAVGDFTEVGSYTGSASPWGTFDQGGNVWEWNEAIVSAYGYSYRSIRAGSFNSGPSSLAASARNRYEPYFENRIIGFRVASIREPPVANANGPYQHECGGDMTVVPLNGTGSSDPDSDEPLDYFWETTCPDGSFDDPYSPTPILTVRTSGACSVLCGVVLTVTDNDGQSDSDSADVTIQDFTPPTIDSVSASPDELWPPNHKMRPVEVSVDVEDACDQTPSCRITSVSSNEPENGAGDGNTAPDWDITGDLSLDLRAERSGGGSGRIYTIGVTCTDACGNSSEETATVTVPHNRGKGRGKGKK
jgi:hypothetical protein